MRLNKSDFGSGFNWGVSTAAYQTEGAHYKDGKGKSIWDVFAHTKGKTAHGHHGDIACDFYHRYTYDICLMSRLNIPNFRFSISWSRIMPAGTGQVNYAGIDFYNRVIDFCLEQNIDPWITLYHWDLPYELEKKGGWTNREIVNWFNDYVAVCMKHFGDRVKRWMILNEPMVFTGAGYFLGIHAPGKKGLNNFLAAAHHAALCQAEGARVVKALRTTALVGTTFSCSLIEPYTSRPQDLLAANRVNALLNRVFSDPLAGKGYPVNDLRFLQRLEPFIKDGDESKLAYKMDFIGIQNYTREVVAFSFLTPFIRAKIIKAEKRGVDTTTMNWEVYPESLYHMLHHFNSYHFPEIIVTEGGASFPDEFTGQEINDFKRKTFLHNHTSQVLRAKNEGVNVNGYFVWSFTDNFEWAEGYHPRFGLIHVDYETQKRTIKSSGHWYGNFLRK